MGREAPVGRDVIWSGCAFMMWSREVESRRARL